MANAGAVRRHSMSPAITPALNPFFGLLPQNLWNNAKDFFAYGDDYLPVGAGLTVPQNIAVQSDSDYLIVGAVAVVTDIANVVFAANRPFLVTILDSGSGRQLQNTAIHLDNLFGTAQLPAYWPFPKLVPRASTLTTTIQSLDAANDFNVRIAYLGFKIFGGM